MGISRTLARPLVQHPAMLSSKTSNRRHCSDPTQRTSFFTSVSPALLRFPPSCRARARLPPRPCRFPPRLLPLPTAHSPRSPCILHLNVDPKTGCRSACVRINQAKSENQAANASCGPERAVLGLQTALSHCHSLVTRHSHNVTLCVWLPCTVPNVLPANP